MPEPTCMTLDQGSLDWPQDEFRPMTTALRRLYHQARLHRVHVYYAVGSTGDSGYRDRCSCGADWAYA